MKGITCIAAALVLLGSLFLFQGTATAESGYDYDGCFMTGGGMLRGMFAAPTIKNVVVSYGILLSCPDDHQWSAAGIEDIEPNVLTVAWTPSNKFLMTHLCHSECTGLQVQVQGSPYIFNTIHGHGEGLFNGKRDYMGELYKIEFTFADKKTAMKDWSSIKITSHDGLQTILDAAAYVYTGGQAAHCPVHSVN